jgi:hypothetical protein
MGQTGAGSFEPPPLETRGGVWGTEYDNNGTIVLRGYDQIAFLENCRIPLRDRQLQRLQAARRGESEPVAEAVDVTVSLAAEHAENSGDAVSLFRQNSVPVNGPAHPALTQ